MALVNHKPNTARDAPTVTTASSSTDKVALFRRLFAGRPDVFPVRWENRKTAKSGYAPACANEWVRGICGKPQVKCGECPHQAFIPVSDDIIEKHLRGGDNLRPSAGDFVAGVYPLLPDETCWFLAADFDKESWAADALAMLETCRAKGVPAALERSRSGNGGHVWIFFSEPIPARTARQLGAAIMTETMERRPEIGFASYDRFFPEPGHHAGRRLRQSDRLAFATQGARAWEQRLHRQGPSSVRRSMGVLGGDATAIRQCCIGNRCRCGDARPCSGRPDAGRRRGCGRTVAHDAVTAPEGGPDRHSSAEQDHHRRRRSALHRPDRFAISDDGAAHTLGSLPKSRVLSRAIHAVPDLRQAPDHLLRRTSCASCGIATGVPRRSR